MNKHKNRFEAAMPKLERIPLFQALERAIQRGAEKIALLIVWFAYFCEYRRAKSDAAPRPSARWVKNQHNAGGRLTVTMFLLFLTVMTILAFDLPLRPDWSELEQRTLTSFPTASVETVLNGEYFSSISTWFADTFPFRESFLKFQSELEELYGFRNKQIYGNVEEGDEIPDATGDAASQEEETDSLSDSAKGESAGDASSSEGDESGDGDGTEEEYETLGTLLVQGNAAYEYYNFVQTRADQYASVISQAAETLLGKADVYNIIVPTSMDICVSEKVRQNLNTSDQEKAIAYMYSSMSSDVHTVDVFDTLQECQENGDYLYFRTDHHWTALGAYRAYEVFTQAAGVTTADLESDFTEKVYEGFTGSFYRNLMSSVLASYPDTIYAYEPKNVTTATITWSDGTTSEYPIINDVSDYTATQKYSAFIGGDNPLTVIENDTITDGSSILLIKESFGNCFAPFLAESYQFVYVIDYRYFDDVDSRNLLEVVEDYDIQDVLFLNNISATRDSAVDLIESFVE